MKNIAKVGLLALIISCTQVWAQAPQGINYQGVARGMDGQPLAQKEISIRISILNQSASGEVEYNEIHEIKTNSFGLFTLVIGQGTPESNDFGFIGWTSGKKWLQIEMDENGGRNFKLMGSQQLMSVPYALYAERSGNGYQAGQGISINNNMITNAGDGDNDSSNELIGSVEIGTDNKLRITDAGGTKETDLSQLLGASQNLSNVLSEGNSAGNSTIANLGSPLNPTDAATKAYVDAHADADASATNELQNLSQVLSQGNDAGGLKIENVGTPTSSNDVATKAYVDAHTDNDANSTNEIQTLTQVLAEGNDAGGAKITNLGTPTINADAATKAYVDDMDALDGDKDASNEIQNLSEVLAQSNSAAGTRITNLGAPTAITDATTKAYVDNLDALDGDKDASNEAQTLSKIGNQINLSDVGGIGGGSIVDAVDDADSNPTNEIQDLSLASNILKITNNASATDIDLSNYLDNTDNQNLSSTSSGTDRTINISDGLGTTFSVDDNDNNATNEAQSISRLGSTVTLTPVGVTGGGSFSVNDNDADPANEIQNLDQVLTISNNAGTKAITNLADPSNAQDAATKKYVDDAEDRLNQKISSTYAFKVAYNFTHTAPGTQVVTIIPDFDDFSVIGSNRFTAPENGVYQFTASGSCNATSIQMQIKVTPISGPIQFYNVKRQLGYPDQSTLNFLDNTILKLNLGDQVELIVLSGLAGEIVAGSFFGFKL